MLPGYPFALVPLSGGRGACQGVGKEQQRQPVRAVYADDLAAACKFLPALRSIEWRRRFASCLGCLSLLPLACIGRLPSLMILATLLCHAGGAEGHDRWRVGHRDRVCVAGMQADCLVGEPLWHLQPDGRGRCPECSGKWPFRVKS
jgi:hypothetical protein